jgi:hypothetical protein
MNEQDVKVGNIVRYKNGIARHVYEIVNTSACIKIGNKRYNIIIYKPLYKNNYELFARPINAFVKCFTLVK